MSVSLPLETMTVEEKLQAMEALWADLNRNDQDVQPPAWHGKVLQDIEAAIERGEESYQDWATAKKQLRKELATPESIS